MLKISDGTCSLSVSPFNPSFDFVLPQSSKISNILSGKNCLSCSSDWVIAQCLTGQTLAVIFSP